MSLVENLEEACCVVNCQLADRGLWFVPLGSKVWSVAFRRV